MSYQLNPLLEVNQQALNTWNQFVKKPLSQRKPVINQVLNPSEKLLTSIKRKLRNAKLFENGLVMDIKFCGQSIIISGSILF